MVSRAFKLRVRRRFRVQQRQVEAFGQQAEAQLERNFFRRLERLREVRRFVGAWLLLFILLGSCLVVQIRALSGYYKVSNPVSGGTYTEGIIGAFTNANPVYATSPVDQAVSHLLFAGLYKYNDRNQVVGDLADGPAVASPDGMAYTVHLRHNLTWQDNIPLTSDDVLFTYQVIQNPDAQSPLNASWQGIKITAPDPYTVTFTLPNVLASFPYSLTTGILPRHALGNTVMSEMRSAAFNTRSPIGAGPFKWQALAAASTSLDNTQQQIVLSPFAHYYDGQPKLTSFVFHTFSRQSDMVTSFNHHELTAMAGLDSVPAADAKDDTVRSYSMPLTAAVMTFFRNNNPVLSDVQVRKALITATDTQTIMDSLGYPTTPVTEPLLRGQLGYDPSYAQPSFDLNTANQMLDQDGWVRAADGVRSKEGKQLGFQLYAENSTEYAKVARMLQKQWAAAGAKVDLQLQNGTDFQSTLAFHSYDALLYGISIGLDPDVFAYWDSTQADIRSANRLNFSSYNSRAADNSLEAGRTRSDPALRIIKYQSFLKSWQSDAPALGLYQPRYLYVTRGEVSGLSEHRINNAVDRYDNVQNWMIRQKLVSQTANQ